MIASGILNRLGLIALAILAFSLPFELESPLIVLMPFSLTNVELLLAACLAITLLVIVHERRWRRPGWAIVPKSWLWLWVLFAFALLASAVLAPEYRVNALKASLRTLSGVLLAFAVPQLVRNKRDLTRIVGGLLVGGLLAATIGFTEMLSGNTFGWLDSLRFQPTAAGPFMRLSGPFNHANQAAMHIEATLPLLVTAGWLAFRRRRYLPGGLLLVAGLIYLQSALLTFSRASYATIFFSNLIAAGVLFSGQLKKRAELAVPWVGVAAFAILLVLANSLASPVLRLRLSSETDNEWYNLQFVAPKEIQVAAGATTEVNVAVANQGTLVWSDKTEQPIRLGARWNGGNGDNGTSGELRWPLARTVRPGESITMTIRVAAPTAPGEYWLEWDMIQESVTWFAEKNGRRTTTRVSVLENLAAVPPEEQMAPPDFDLLRRPIPDRRTLWLLAGRQLRERPVQGIGLDNFRLTYGQVAGWQAWNTTIHTNNWYIETVVSLGLIGSLPFFIWLLLLGRDIFVQLRRPQISSGNCVWQIGLAVGLLSFIIHGLLDYFLLFNSTALLFWMLVGLWVGLRLCDGKPAGKGAGIARGA